MGSYFGSKVTSGLCQPIIGQRVQHVIRTLIDSAIAEATLLKWMMQLHQALACWEQAAIDQILAQPTLRVDETSLRVDRQNHWIHVYAAGDIT